MMQKPKYSIGDTVWVATTTTEQRSEPCSLCLGEATWQTTAPNGHVFSLDCPKCSRGYHSDGLATWHEHTAVAATGVITRVSVEKDGPEYLVDGRGFFAEPNVSDDYDTALAVAKMLAVKKTAELLENARNWGQSVKNRRSVYRHRMNNPFRYAEMLEANLERLRRVVAEVDDPRCREVAKWLTPKKLMAGTER